MIFFSLGESLNACLGAFLYSAAASVIYEALLLLIRFALAMFGKNEYYIYKKGNNIKKAAAKIKERLKADTVEGWIFAYHFFFTLLFGLGYLVMQYAFCDGVFRLYFLICTLASFFGAKKIYKRYLYAYFLSFISYLGAGFIIFSSIIITPFYKLSLKLIGIFKAACRCLIKLLKRRRSISLLRQKRRG